MTAQTNIVKFPKAKVTKPVSPFKLTDGLVRAFGTTQGKLENALCNCTNEYEKIELTEKLAQVEAAWQAYITFFWGK